MSDTQIQAGEELRKALARFGTETILGILSDLLAEGSNDETDGRAASSGPAAVR